MHASNDNDQLKPAHRWVPVLGRIGAGRRLEFDEPIELPPERGELFPNDPREA
jgi:hypothetical protein